MNSLYSFSAPEKLVAALDTDFLMHVELLLISGLNTAVFDYGAYRPDKISECQYLLSLCLEKHFPFLLRVGKLQVAVNVFPTTVVISLSRSRMVNSRISG